MKIFSVKNLSLVAITIFSLNIFGCQLADPDLQNANKYEANKWYEIQPGLSYQKIVFDQPNNIPSDSTNSNQTPGTHPLTFHVVKINPNLFQFKVIENQNQKAADNIQKIHQSNNSLFSFNGSFFDTEFNPTGLVISENNKSNSLSPSELSNGVMTINNQHQPLLFSSEEFSKLKPTEIKNLEFALQNGPILIDREGHSAIKKDSGKLANRTTLGLDDQNNLIVIINRSSLLDSDQQLSLFQFAQLLENNSSLQSLNLQSVLNLDGGPSTGFALQDVYYPELAALQNVVITLPRK